VEHLAEQRALDLVAGRLPEPAASDAHAHLDTCDECRALIAQLIRTEPPLDEATPPDAGVTVPELPAGRRSRPPLERVDEYQLLALVGRGGMGTVYLARDTLLDRDVALKLIPRASSELARQRFLIEARAVARIRHPNVVVVHRVGMANEQPYIVYDLVRGRTFGELPRPAPWPKVLELAVGATRGLAAAHACSVLHRDIKPANMMLDEQGDVVLVDFGLAKLALDAEPDGQLPDAPLELPDLETSITNTGIAMGTPRYMAPEAWRGAAATPQTDLYSLGVVLFELLTGDTPFGSYGGDTLAGAVVELDPPAIASVAPWLPPELARLVDACIAREPVRRPASAAALGDALEALQRGRAFDLLERDRVVAAPAGNPYAGARCYEFGDHAAFFGRRDELRALIEQLRERPFVALAGAAGTGKSSLARAGVLPLIYRGALGGARRWVPIELVPGEHPLAALTAALAHHVDGDPATIPARLADDATRAQLIARFRGGCGHGCTAHVLLLDQLEQLVTTSDRDEAAAFARLLGELVAVPSHSLRVIATLDAAHLLAVAALPGLGPVIAPAVYLVLPPRDAALHDIIVEPARLTGRALDDATVRALLAEQLPLGELSQRLAALWPRLSASVSGAA